MQKVLKVIGVITAAIAMVVLTICLLALGVKKPVEKTFEKESMTEIMEKIDIWKLMYKDGKKGGSPTALGTRVYNYFDNIGLTKEDVDNVVQDKAFKSIIGNYLGTMFMNGITGVEVIYPTKGELVNFLHTNYSRFQNVTGFPKDYREDKITEIVDNNYSNVKKELNEIAKEIKFDQVKHVDLIKKVFSINSWILIGIVIVCLIALILIASITRGLRLAGIAGLIAGVIFTIIGLLGSKVIGSFVDFKDYQSVVEPVINSIAKNMLIYGIILLALSVVAIAISFFIKPKTKVEVKEEKVD